MKKGTSFSTQGQRADIGDLTINRILPNRYADAVGPFVFLDHIVPKLQPADMDSGTGAHPHRGIATLSYIIEGEDEHFDSAGNYAKVHSGGVQWMKAGNGIVHDETLNVDSHTDTNRTHAFQFWINLPAKNKAEKP
jgi:redox-sensitive bicupin YhaK (pirin superfamily)